MLFVSGQCLLFVMNSSQITEIVSLLTAFGVGSIVTAVIQSWLTQKGKQDKRRFQEKQTPYVGLLEAYHKAAVGGTEDAGKQFAYWQMRCELVASESVRDAISRIVMTNDDRQGRQVAHEDMKKAMRDDLGITR
ncbi:MAG: hypothetical protein ABF979_10635 [Gluconobacter sp.]|uniref:hypothetical protein n=1 Tax=Gluconobacter sp. TaxID=1876758 RepID=UPI0039EC69CA